MGSRWWFPLGGKTGRSQWSPGDLHGREVCRDRVGGGVGKAHAVRQGDVAAYVALRLLA